MCLSGAPFGAWVQRAYRGTRGARLPGTKWRHRRGRMRSEPTATDVPGDVCLAAPRPLIAPRVLGAELARSDLQPGEPSLEHDASRQLPVPATLGRAQARWMLPRQSLRRPLRVPCQCAAADRADRRAARRADLAGAARVPPMPQPEEVARTRANDLDLRRLLPACSARGTDRARRGAACLSLASPPRA